MSIISEFGGCDAANDCNEIVFIKSLKKYTKSKTNKVRELKSINMLMFNFIQDLLSLQIGKRDIMHQYAVITKLLQECSVEQRLLDDHNELFIKTFAKMVNHGQHELQEIDKKIKQILLHIEKFNESIQDSKDMNNQDNNYFISILSDKLKELYEKCIIQHKKATLESLITKLIQDKDLFSHVIDMWPME